CTSADGIPESGPLLHWPGFPACRRLPCFHTSAIFRQPPRDLQYWFPCFLLSSPLCLKECRKISRIGVSRKDNNRGYWKRGGFSSGRLFASPQNLKDTDIMPIVSCSPFTWFASNLCIAPKEALTPGMTSKP